MSSNRLPGKMLMNFNGIPLLERVIDRVSLAKEVTKIVIATSDSVSDNGIESFCFEKGIECFKGDLKNVADRFLQLVKNKNVNSFVRINGDSPLIDPGLVDMAINYFNISECDIVTNALPRTFPKGQSVEVIRAESFKNLVYSGLDDEQKEHVTKKYYDFPEKYKIVNFTSGGSFNNINMCIDDYKDILILEKVLKRVGKKKLNWKDLCQYFSDNK